MTLYDRSMMVDTGTELLRKQICLFILKERKNMIYALVDNRSSYQRSTSGTGARAMSFAKNLFLEQTLRERK